MSNGWDIALIDKTLPSEAILERAIEAGGKVILYDGRAESAHQVLSRVVDWAQQSGCAIRSLSLLSHAAPGRFELGNQWISKSSIDEIALDLQRLGKAMADGGSINLYGCSLADPLGDGQILMDRVATLAKARVFASSNITGRCGDWVLETASDDKTNAVSPINPFSTQVLAQWPYSLPGAGITVSPTSGLATTENGGTATFTVVLASNPGGGGSSVSVGLSSSDLTEGTVSPALLTFSNANWNVPQTVTVTGVDDVLFDGNVGYTIVTAPAISTSGSYNGFNASDVSVTNVDNDTPGISVTPTSGLTTSEVGGTATFGIFLNSQPTANVTIPISSSNTAEGTVSPASLTFTTANWATTQTVTVTGVDDLVDDGNIAYSIVTGAATSADANYTGLNPSDVSVSNSDNDTAEIIVTPTSGLITTEGGSAASFTVVLASQPTANASVGISSSNTAEGTVAVSSLTFTAANWSTPQTVTVTGVDDSVDDGDIGYSIVTAAAASSDSNYNALNPSDVSVTNTDNDTAGITISPTSGLVTTEAGGTASFTAVLTSQPTANAAIGISSSNTAEGTVSASSLTFTAANWNMPQTITVMGVDDFVDDGNIAYSIVTAAAVSADLNYSGRNASDVSVSNSDNDTAGVTVSPTAGLVTTEAGGSASFTIVLTSQPTVNVTIPISSSNTAEGTVSASSLIFTSANWNVAQSVTVTGINDFVDDGDIAYTIVTGAGTSGDANYSGINPADVTFSNTDDDVAGISVSPTSGLVITEAGGMASFTVVLDSKPTSNVTIGVSSSNTSEGTVAASSVTFTTANWNIAQTIAISGVNDFVDDGDVAFTIITAAASSADPLYDTRDATDVSVSNTDDDTAGITVAPTSGLTTTEGGGTASFTVVLNSQPTADVAIGLSSSNPTEGTISASSITFTPANWSAPRTLVITGVDDVTDDGDIAYTIVTAAASSADINYNGRDPSNVSVVNTDNDTTGITISPTAGLTTTEAGGTASFTIVLTSRPSADVTIPLSSSNIAEATVSSSSVNFTTSNWDTPQIVTVTGVDDLVQDGDVSYSIMTGAASSADVDYAGFDPSDVSGSNLDNDTAGISVSPVSGLSTTEAGGTASFTIVLTSRPTANVTVPLSSSNSAEGTVSASSVTFTSADWNIARTVTLTGVNDFVEDGNAAYVMLTGAATSADASYNGINPADVSLTNIDDDAAGIVVSPISGLVTTEAGGGASFTIVLNSQPTANVTIAIASGNSSEGACSVPSVTFTSANWNTPQTISVTGVDDSVDDGDVSYSVTTGGAVSSDPNYNGINPADVALINTDNDTAGITVSPTSGRVTSEVGGTATFTIVLGSQPTADVTIPISSSNVDEGSLAVSSLTFTSANWNAPQTVTITGVDDSVDDGDIVYAIVTGAATSGDANYNGMNPSDVSVANTDNDTAGITISPTSGLTTTEAGGTTSFTVVLNSQPTANIVIAVSSANLSEGTVSPASLTFTAGNWNSSQTITLSGIDDFIDDGDISYAIATAAAVSADSKYNGVDAADVVVTNIDDDTAGITVTPTSGLSTTEAGGTATFTVVLNSQPSANVTIPISSSNTGEGVVSPTSITFTSANWSIARLVTITGVDDLIRDGDISFSILTAPATSADPKYSGRNASDVSAINIDNDNVGVTITPTSGLVTTEAGGTGYFDVRLNSKPTANVTIPLSSSNTAEGVLSTSSLTFSPVNWNINQTVTVTGVDDLIDDGDAAYSVITAAAVSTDSSYNGFNSGDVALVNTDDDTVGFSVTPTSGLTTTEAGGSATFSVHLDSQPTANVTVSLASSNSGEGALSVHSITFTPANWNTVQIVTVTGVDDDIDDGDIVYSVTTGCSSTDALYAAIDPPDVSVTNTNDDLAGIAVTPISGLRTTEAGGTANFTVALNSQPTADVSISISSGDPSEAIVSASALTFTSANWYLPQAITVTGMDDFVRDGDVVYTIVTGAAASVDASYNGINPNDVAGSNSDDDVAEVVVSPVSGHATTEAGATAILSIVLTSQPAATVTIPLSSSDLTEGALSVSSVSFDATDWSVPHFVTITGIDDLVQDGDIAYTILTSPAVSADPFYDGINSADVSIVNADNDVAGVTVTPISGLNTTEAGGTAIFTVVLDVQPSANVKLSLSSSDPGEADISASRLTFTPGNWNVPQVVTVTGVDDHIIDGDQSYSIILAPAVSADPHYNGINPSDVTGNNTDDDVAAIVVTPTSGLVTRENGATASFTVVLTTQPAANVSIGLSSSNTAEGSVLTPGLTFTPANWNSPQQVIVAGVDDAVVDNDIAYIVITNAASSADPNYNGLAASDVSLTNIDNDNVGITILPVTGLSTTEAGGAVALDILLAKQPTANVTLTLSSSNTAEGIVSRSSLTFTVANWDVARRITVSGVNDLVDDGDVQYDLIASVSASADPDYAALAAKRVALTNTDDDTAGFTITSGPQNTTSESGGTASFDIVLNSQPRGNVFLALRSGDRTEGLPTLKSLTFTHANWNLPQKFTIRGVNDFTDDGDIPYRVSVQPLSSNADLKYAALPAQNIFLTNLDDDTAGLVIVTPAHRLITTEAGGEATIQVSLSTQPTSDVRVTIQSSDLSEATVGVSTLFFTPANWSTLQTVAVNGVDDAVVDGDMAYQIIIVPSRSADAAYQDIDPSALDATNLDDDTAAISITTLSADDASASFSVRLASRPKFPVLVVLSIADVNGTLSSAQLTFSPDQWNQPQPVTLRFSDRTQFADGSLIAVATSADPQYNQSRSSTTFQRPAEVSVHAVLIQPHETDRIPFDFELSRATIRPTPVPFPKLASLARWPVTFLNAPPQPATAVADLKDSADPDDAPDMPPDDPPIPDGPDPIPLDPQGRMLRSDCGFAKSGNQIVPAPMASSRPRFAKVLGMLIPFLLSHWHLSRAKRESNRARRPPKARAKLRAPNP